MPALQLGCARSRLPSGSPPVRPLRSQRSQHAAAARPQTTRHQPRLPVQRAPGRSVVARAVTNQDEPVVRFTENMLEVPIEPHPELIKGRLDNGFEYVVLPNKSPPNRFEVHLQMHVGSVDEKDDEQGVAHFVEHVTFLGSSKREILIGFGARSNAYTDFQHTVFHVNAELEDRTTGTPMLQFVLDALHQVAFGAEFLPSRVEKERKAVLAEAQMMNTMEYRVDCNLLTYLHEENKIGSRFPIGMVDQVKTVTREKLVNFYNKWYFPANATLYVVGDFSPDKIQGCVNLIQTVFGSVRAPKLEDGSLRERGVRPPLEHNWGLGPFRTDEKLPCPISMFRHPLMSNYILTVHAKLPIHALKLHEHLCEVLIFRIIISIFQRRIGARYVEGAGSFHHIEYEIADSGREGSCIVSLTITAEPKDWKEATRTAVQEAQRLVQHGVTRTELQLYTEALMNDGAQLAACQDSQPHLEILELAMETIYNKQVYSSNIQSYEAMLAVAPYITEDVVNATIRSFFAPVANFAREAEVQAHAAANPDLYVEPGPIRCTSIIACVPRFVQESGEAVSGGIASRSAASLSTGGHLDGEGIDVEAVAQPGVAVDDDEDMPPPPGQVRFDCSEEDITAVLSEQHDMEQMEDVSAPDTFIPKPELQALLEKYEPAFVPVVGREDEGPKPPAEPTSGVVQRRLSNGATMSYKVSDNDPGSTIVRMALPGGKAAEVRSGAQPAGVGAIQVGMRALSESGTIVGCKREEVEMFCLARLISCVIDTDDENTYIDWQFQSTDSGVYGVFELIHLIIERPYWDEKALERSKTAVLSDYRAISKSLERANYDRIQEMLFGDDRRFREPTPDEIAALTLEGVSGLVSKYLRPDRMEISVVGDCDPEVLEDAFFRYMGTMAPRSEPPPPPLHPMIFQNLPVDKRHQSWHLEDSDMRGIGNIAGTAFRRWGDIFGSGPVEPLTSRPKPPKQGTTSAKTDPVLGLLTQTIRRSHPLFAAAVLLFLQEIINARLFSVVRDQLNLTYDVRFEIIQHDRLNVSWWCVHVTAETGKIGATTDASLKVLRDAQTNQPITEWDVDKTRQALLARHSTDLKDNTYVLNLITHLQAPDVPLKTVDCLRDLTIMMRTINASDVNAAYRLFGLQDDEIYTSVGTAGPVAPMPAPVLKRGVAWSPPAETKHETVWEVMGRALSAVDPATMAGKGQQEK